MIRRPLTCCLPLALLLSSAQAQESKPQDAGLTAAQQEFAELSARYQAEFDSYVNTHKKLLRRGQQKKADKHRRENRPAESYIAEFTAGAKKYQGTPGAAAFLGWLVSSNQSSEELGKQAASILFADHLTSPEMRNLLSATGVRRMVLAYGRDGMRDKLRLLVEKSSHAAVRDPSRYILAQGALRDPEITAAERKAALAELRLLGAESKTGTLAKQAKAVVFETERLQLGMQVPELSGKDLNGRSIRLSDFRGQVVLLGFSSDAVTACRATYTHNKSMYKKFAPTGRYVQFGVSCDDDLEYARHRAKESGLYWRSLWNGNEGLAGGPAQLWNISSLPTFYVIDEEGIIRHKALRGLVLEKSIEKLLTHLGVLDKD